MISREKFRELLSRLLAKSQANNVNWQRTSAELYFVEFGDGLLITVTYGSPSSEPDWVGAHLSVRGADVITIVAEEGESDEFEFLKDLYNDAQRCVLGWDSALKQIEDALASDSTVGVEPPPPYPDIPF